MWILPFISNEYASGEVDRRANQQANKTVVLVGLKQILQDALGTWISCSTCSKQFGLEDSKVCGTQRQSAQIREEWFDTQAGLPQWAFSLKWKVCGYFHERLQDMCHQAFFLEARQSALLLGPGMHTAGSQQQNFSPWLATVAHVLDQPRMILWKLI